MTVYVYPFVCNSFLMFNLKISLSPVTNCHIAMLCNIIQASGSQIDSIYWINWWEKISDVKIKYCPLLEEDIPFGFASNHELIQVLNYCVMYAT